MSKYVGKIITNQAPAGYSVGFDGTGDWLSIADSPQFTLGTSNYTMEFWAYPTSFSAQVIPFSYQWSSAGGTRLIVFAQNTNGTYLVYYYDASNSFTTTTAVALNQWSHIALVRNGNVFTLYINGVATNTATNAITYPDSPLPVYIGSSYDGSTGAAAYVGYISNVRVVIGTAVYTSNFTPPTQLFPITNTRLLTCQSPTIVDNSTNNLTITNNGDARVSTFTPFAAYNPVPTSANPLIPAPGVWTLDEALQYTQQGVWPSYAVNAIEDVFSTWLYTGNGSTQTITNNINVSGRGGLVWTKARSSAVSHILTDTVRGANSSVFSDLTIAAQTGQGYIGSFLSNGFTVGSSANAPAVTYASWTFCEQAKFFDVVTYTGNGSNRTISHNLGSTPGCIIVKRTDTTGNWAVYHRSLISAQYVLYLQGTTAQTLDASMWNSTAPTSTVFSVGTSADVNANGGTYVAYLFAHDAGGFGPSGNENVISCGSYTGTGAVGLNITLGYEPQWILIKSASGNFGWFVVDNMRGMPVGVTTMNLSPNTAAAENSPDYGNAVQPTATGFTINSNNSNFNNAGGTFIYIAIRRGPMRPPSIGTSVFSPVAQTGTGAVTTVTHGFPVDLWIASDRNNTSSLVGYKQAWFDRLLGDANGFITATIAGWGGGWGSSYFSFQNNIGVPQNGNFAFLNNAATPYVYWGFRRAPGFFDQVAYTGTGSVTTFTHNLTIVPEMMIVKRRGATGAWNVYVSALGNSSYLILNTTAAVVTGDVTRWGSTTPTASVFTLGANIDVNQSGITGTYTAYLFATVGGVSKVGSYTGTGALQTINCGFTTGARFILIKRTDSTGNWYIYDSARGISSGNDPYLLMNTQAVEVTGTNYVDTTPVGFQVTAAAPADLNASGGNYIFLAIA